MTADTCFSCSDSAFDSSSAPLKCNSVVRRRRAEGTQGMAGKHKQAKFSSRAADTCFTLTSVSPPQILFSDHKCNSVVVRRVGVQGMAGKHKQAPGNTLAPP